MSVVVNGLGHLRITVDFCREEHPFRLGELCRAFPQAKTKVSVLILIHEISGLNAWAEGIANELAGQGFIATDPDLLRLFRTE
jgi:Dienelactone hydrolase family